MIEKIFPASGVRLRIVRAIYENPGLNITELIKKAKASPNLTISYVNVLTKSGVVKERVTGGKIKPHVRELEPNLQSDVGKLLFTFLEIDKKCVFLEKYRELKPIVSQLEDLFRDSGVKFCLVYGSFARFSADRESDIDVLVVGELKKHEKTRLSEIFVTLKREYSIRIGKPDNFVKNIGNPFHQNILKDHIVIWNESEFIETLASAT